MTDRRRNAFVLLLVAALVAISALIIASKPTRLGLDLKGGVQLIYEGEPTPQVPKVDAEAVDNAISTIRKRTDALGVSEPEIQRCGDKQICVGLPDVKNFQRAEQQVGSTAQLQFYDWEPNIFEAPNKLVDPATAAQSNAPDNPIFSLYQAVLRASQSKPRAEAEDVPAGGPEPAIVQKFNGNQQQIRQYYDNKNDTTGDQYYLFGPAPKGQDPKLITGPEANCQALLSDFTAKLSRIGPKPTPITPPKGTQCADQLATLGNAGPPAGSKVLKVPKGVIVIGAEATKGAKPGAPPPGYFVLEDDSSLSGSDIRKPKQESDQAGAPNVTFQFSGFGRRQFASTTKRIAERGSRQIVPPGVPPSQATQFADQRFAITLDDQIISLATVDFRDNPEGIDGRTGAEINNIGSLQEAQDLAKNLRIGALPIKLKQISKTQVSSTLGKQALHQGLVAGAVGLILVLLFLLTFYRRAGLGGRGRAPDLRGDPLRADQADPDHAHAAGHRGHDPHARRGGRRQHRHLRANKGGGTRAALRFRAPSRRATARPSRRSSTRTSSRSASAFILFMLATAGVKGFAFTLRRRHARLAVHRGARHLGDPRVAGAHASAPIQARARRRGKERIRWHFDFMGKSKWFFSMSGVILRRRRARDRGPGRELRHRLQLRHAHHHAALRRRPTSPRCATCCRRSATATRRSSRFRNKQLGAQRLPDHGQEARAGQGQRAWRTRSTRSSVSCGRTSRARLGGPDLRRPDREDGGHRDHRLAAPDLDLHRDEVRVEVRGAGADRPGARPSDHHRRLRAHRREVTTDTVAALLTILGYSLYDTIIVFDRVRENVPRMPRATFSQIVNRSMAEVLTRSLATSF